MFKAKSFMHKLPVTMFFASLLQFWFVAEIHAADPNFGPSPYPYTIKDQDVNAVLREFGENLRYKVVIGNGFNTKAAGNLPTKTANEFLDALARQNSFDWYYDGVALHFTVESENSTRFFLLDGVSHKELLSELDRLGVSSSKYSVKWDKGSHFVSAKGPPRFNEIVGETLFALSTGNDPSMFRVGAKPTSSPVTIYRGSNVNVQKFGKD